MKCDYCNNEASVFMVDRETFKDLSMNLGPGVMVPLRSGASLQKYCEACWKASHQSNSGLSPFGKLGAII